MHAGPEVSFGRIVHSLREGQCHGTQSQSPFFLIFEAPDAGCRAYFRGSFYLIAPVQEGAPTETHVKIVGWLAVVVSAFSYFVALFFLLLLAFPVTAINLGFVGTVVLIDAELLSVRGMPVGHGGGLLLCSFFLVLALSGIVAGWGLLRFKNWARILAIVLAILSLPNVPFGTAFGIYALVVLFNKRAGQLFT